MRIFSQSLEQGKKKGGYRKKNSEYPPTYPILDARLVPA
jgi:hypothetical protein